MIKLPVDTNQTTRKNLIRMVYMSSICLLVIHMNTHHIDKLHYIILKKESY